MSGTSLNVALPGLDSSPNTDVIPTGYTLMTGQSAGKVTGSAGDDRATLSDLQQDNDQVIKMGAGDDIFVFGAAQNAIAQAVDLNGIVKMGDDGFDVVYLNNLITDYIFTIRADGGIKIQYMNEPDGKGDAVTFEGAEQFVFRNIASDGTNYENIVYTYAELYALI